MASKYPDELDGLPTDELNSTKSNNTHPALHNDVNAGVNAIQAALGTNPGGPTGTVAERLAASLNYFVGDEETVEPLIAELEEGTEYRWDKTDGAGTLLDVITGVA